MRVVRQLLLVLFVAGAIMMVGAGCSADSTSATQHNGDDHMAGNDMHDGDDDHDAMLHIHADLPHEYEDVTNPFAGDEQAVAAGKQLYELNCATCHGPEGRGDGPAAVALTPAPANLADGTMMMDLSDVYLFWRVSEGGAMEPFNSAMPAWKDVLSVEQRWQVVNYLRTLDH